ncbi:glycosyltransferase family 10 domain-containing protein [Pedobacter cryoconitis]|uniref:Glycosyl transferase family 10 (Putative fucosyltransferase) n=1 Tax=Pedobacter cryoconitis TaxID=188932 RepID=A0A327T5T1_9SPHI|nr:glycosyltransferase family 10 [Pedobacter cryoconitis]RAJ35434.1 glycosyl transferase family 10 (putative fucosyltransferase) [Pedobacter cryoconitis]
MKIKFFSDYEVSENLLIRFKANYKVDDEVLTFTTADDYDYAVVFNRANDPLKPGAKVITVIQEPSWSDAHQNKFYLTNSDYILVHDPELFEKNNNVKLGGKIIETPAFMFYHDHVDHSFYDHTEQIKKEKKLSMIVSGLYFNIANYHKRIDVLVKILESDLDIDIYGRGLTIQDPRYKGDLKYKYTGLLPYEYSIAIENSNEKNYITEKFVDCVLCNTTPIYNGAPNLAEVYDQRYYRTISLDSPHIVQDLKEIIVHPAPGSVINKDIYFEKYNLYTKLKEIIYG